jgi:hypothetical protein
LRAHGAQVYRQGKLGLFPQSLKRESFCWIAYADAFRAIMIAFIVATLLVPLLRNLAPSGASDRNLQR